MKTFLLLLGVVLILSGITVATLGTIKIIPVRHYKGESLVNGADVSYVIQKYGPWKIELHGNANANYEFWAKYDFSTKEKLNGFNENNERLFNIVKIAGITIILIIIGTVCVVKARKIRAT